MRTRRDSLKLLGATPLVLGGCASSLPEVLANKARAPINEGPDWGQTFEGQRQADRGDGTFLNPILAGDHPDPSIIRVGETYYLTFSSFDAYPGLLIWQSKDLVNWSPLGPALKDYIGSVWAPDLIHHDGRFYIYIPARTADYKSIYVITADDINGPWSEPVDLHLPDHIDPGHIVGEDGNRYLFLSNGDLVQLADDGLSTVGEVKHVYDPWRYPEDWDVECFCPEGPKMLRRGEWFYMLTAVGGTAGPPTGHMVIAARSKSVFGPWAHAPNNPQVRTASRAEAWWSRGHATLIEGPQADDWWLIYHGYEREFWTLGRQCLLEPVKWRDDGWFEALGADLSKPLPMPKGGEAIQHGLPLSDDFSAPDLKPQWAFYNPGAAEYDRLQIGSGELSLAAKGAEPRDSSPLCFVTGDRHYSVEVEIERDPSARGGLLLFYNDGLYCGLGFDEAGLVMHRYGQERRRQDIAPGTTRLFLKVTNREHIVTFHFSLDGETWTKFDVQMEVSGYHHNVGYDFLSLRPAIYAAKEGAVRFRNLVYRGQYDLV
ncbi:family 43 glycosylhydrolase [Parvularcula marina]|uniref:Xylan 1,4-beta-xylosidase n=1 Tax=Parvularcula marina TaxID=2292771 RepID=A0A371RKJ5_9PROT|nr:xylan 1,4-beta-xylosidase [Parvularcula marina]